MSLLDDVSIVVTPNGYKAGELYAVIPVPTEGAEQVTNGDFATDTGWDKRNGSTISGGVGNVIANGDLGNTGNNWSLNQGVGMVVGKLYKISFSARQTGGTGNLQVGQAYTAGFSQNITSGFVNYSFIITPADYGVNTERVSIGGSVIGDTFEVDNVSVKEYTAADMDVTRATAATRVDEDGLVNYAEVLGSEEVTNGDFATDLSGWTISGNDATHTVTWTASGARFQSDTTSPVMEFKQLNLLTSGKQYVLTCNIAYTGVGQLRVNVGSNLTAFTEGANTRYFSATSSTMSFLRENANVDAIISNVSVKELIRDNVPRIDYSGGGCPHILAEPQRTNLVTESSDYSGYSKSSINIVSNISTSPDGSVNATSVTNTSTGQSHIRTGFTASSTGDYTGSSYIKKQDFDFIYVEFGNAYAWFNISNGTLGNSGNFGSGWTFVSHSIESVGNDWYRISITANNTITGGYNFRPYQPTSANGNYTSGSLGDSFMWGTQVEQGSYATSYIPTSGSTVTRNQDQFTRDGISSLINSTEGVFMVELSPSFPAGTRQISLNDGSYVNRIIIEVRNSGGTIKCLLVSSSVVQAEIDYTVSNILDYYKVAIRYELNNVSIWVNGLQIGSTDTSATMPIGLNSFSFDGNSLSGLPFYGKVKQLQVYSTALSDEQLIQLTGTSGTDFYESYAAMASALTYTIQ